MRWLNWTEIAPGKRQPITSGSLEHLFNSYQESIGSIVLSLFPDMYTYNFPSVLFGVRNTGSGSNYVISAGATAEPHSPNIGIYQVDATSFTLGGGEKAVVVRERSYFVAANADPITFTDNSTGYVHIIDKLKIVSGTNATENYVCDYADLIFLTSNGWKGKTITSGMVSANSGSVTFTSGSITYKIIANVMHFNIEVLATVISGSPTSLNIDLSSIFEAAGKFFGVANIGTLASLQTDNKAGMFVDTDTSILKLSYHSIYGAGGLEINGSGTINVK